MLFTLFDNFNNVYGILFIICNTDTNLYDFYIKRNQISSQLNLYFAFIYE